MAKRPTTSSTTNKSESKELIINSKAPLVFISHDTRDGDLAEEFSNLLRNASAGALKSFRSSDRKGTQGIEYGEEWYPAIMDKIDEASDVVCLLTKHSVDRPWILYEAGVAKGKLDKKVLGIALGIPLRVAVSGPFAQFQNNDGDVESVTNLVMTLVKKVPGLDPDQTQVKTLVQGFVVRCIEIIDNQNSGVAAESVEENAVAKLFEEVKIMFDALPSRIENRVDPNFNRRRRRVHPMMVEEMLHMGKESKDPLLGFLMMVSLFREDFPWLYEVGLDTYRTLKSFKTSIQTKRAISTFESALEMAGHPLMREFLDRSEDSLFLFKEMRHVTRHYLERFINHNDHTDDKDRND
ncbi:TIR domain-containing protein [Mucilaginibacter lappiensis]|uniref:TIR domain-containing protein n=1 Tax=Mucilaginibacter lappiensis TaxID=354630 RepID=A0ABR6PRV7_9SPHI|nr:toll/interleukin-1 receptor domain-containing protein [Mucilaginibacter lappiensis]MBB6112522.1 hypothetical protein [Mucilaginibacter lappiensis]SIS02685.1 TIR domain-containing protein [Mucilaginibacter lappiensis]